MVDVVAVVNTLKSEVLYLRTIDSIQVDTSTITIGSNAVTVRCRIADREGEWLAKCYVCHRDNLRAIYSDAYYEAELGIYSLFGSIEYVDLVLQPWVEGRSLDTLLGDSRADYARLSRAFDTMALQLVSMPYAHGDIKPENIIVGDDYVMRLVDYDAAWFPGLGYCSVEEMGTENYRHPLRTYDCCYKSIDDYSIALVSVMLASLAVGREVMEPLLRPDKSLFTPSLAIKGRDEVLSQATALLREYGDMAHCRMAEALQRSFVSIYGLHDALHEACEANPNI